MTEPTPAEKPDYVGILKGFRARCELQPPNTFMAVHVDEARSILAALSAALGERVTREQVDKACECAYWATDFAVSGGHHYNCDRFDPKPFFACLSKMVDGMEMWAADEDGIHSDAWDAYCEACRLLIRELKSDSIDEPASPPVPADKGSEGKGPKAMWPTDVGLWHRDGGAIEPWAAKRDIETKAIIVRNIYGESWYCEGELPTLQGWRRNEFADALADANARIAELEKRNVELVALSKVTSQSLDQSVADVSALESALADAQRQGEAWQALRARVAAAETNYADTTIDYRNGLRDVLNWMDESAPSTEERETEKPELTREELASCRQALEKVVEDTPRNAIPKRSVTSAIEKIVATLALYDADLAAGGET